MDVDQTTAASEGADITQPTITESLSSILDKKFNNQYDVLPEVYEEMKQIKDEAIKNGNFMKWPNWKETNLQEKQRLLVRTKAFKSWFGDWENDKENSSKVLDKNWEPLVFYHATDNIFTEFSREKATEYSDVGKVFWFGSEKNPETRVGHNVFGVFLKAINPIRIDTDEFLEKVLTQEFPDKYWLSVGSPDKEMAIRKYIEQNNFDVVLTYDPRFSTNSNIGWGDPNVFRVFNPNQIKSIDNYWYFSDWNNNIKY